MIVKRSTFIHCLCLFFTVLTFVSCEPIELDTKGEVSPKTYYTSEKELEDGVVGIYGLYHRATWSIDILAAYSGADDITGRISSSKAVMLEADQFYRSELNSGNYYNSWMSYIWDYYYKTILACNSFLAYATSTEIDEVVFNNARANAHFIRGMLYFQLAMVFQDIPMPLVPEPDVNMGKTPMRDVLGQAIFDLEYAAEWALCERDIDPTIADGHVTKTAAKAYLAKVYMQLTGWPFSEDDKWEKVKDLTQSIINAGVYSLNDDYAACFQDPCQINKEMIWASICERGIWPEKAESRYFGYKWSYWADVLVENLYYEKFPAGYRKRFSIVGIQDTSNTDVVSEYYKRLVIAFNHPFVTKFSYATIKGTPEFEHAWQTSNDTPVLRFSEVVLMYAEACANLGETTEAIEKLNWVKRRAFAFGLTTQEEVAELPEAFWLIPDDEIDYTIDNLPTREALVNAIVNERSFEFLGEPGGNYWLDLVRLEKVAEANADRDDREAKLLGDPEDRMKWFFSIPNYEIEANPNLK